MSYLCNRIVWGGVSAWTSTTIVDNNENDAPMAGKDCVIYFTDKDNGRTVTMPVNVYFVVSLPENPTIGNQWFFGTTDGLVFEDVGYTGSDKRMMGGGGVHTWVIGSTGSTGLQKVSSALITPWHVPIWSLDELHDLKFKRFTLDVQVLSPQNAQVG